MNESMNGARENNQKQPRQTSGQSHMIISVRINVVPGYSWSEAHDVMGFYTLVEEIDHRDHVSDTPGLASIVLILVFQLMFPGDNDKKKLIQ
jgi:hypothetical protein